MILINWLKVAQFSQGYYVFPAIIFIFIAYISLRFFLNYLSPAKELNNKISQLADELDKLNDNSNLDKDSLDVKFEGNPSLKQAWISYKQTFHDTYETVDGEAKVAYSRAPHRKRAFWLSR